MKKELISKNGRRSHYKFEFQSMGEFIKYLKDNDSTPKNYSDKYEQVYTNSRRAWYGSRNLDDAIETCENGWTEKAKRLTTKIKTYSTTSDFTKYQKRFIDQAGFQPIVPLYLAGVPNNMMNSRFEQKKQKVITITKSVGYRGEVSLQQIEEESLKTLSIVKMLESKGYRINLNVCNTWKACDNTITLKINIKKANEKLNISKVAFPLTHPSMLRRLIFRFREVIPEHDTRTVGGSMYDKQSNIAAIDPKKEIFIPSFMDLSMDEIKDIKDVENGFTVDDWRKKIK